MEEETERCGNKWIQLKDPSVLTKPLPTRWEAPASLSAPGTKKSTSEGSGNVLHIPIHPSPVQGRPVGTGHTCPVCKPSGTWAHRLRLAEETPRVVSLLSAWGTSLGTCDTRTWAHNQALGPCASPATHAVTATASFPPLMCQHNLLPLLSQPRAGHGRGQQGFERGPRG